MPHIDFNRHVSVLLLLLLCAGAFAYDNDGRDAQGNGLLKGGPHRTINELALDYYIKNMAPERLREGCFNNETTLTGPTVVAPGMELINTGDRSHPFRWWVIEGGYTADEPELYNSFRHFYDPTSLAGVPYLTDHLEMLDWVYRAIIFTSVKGLVVGAAAGFSGNPQVNARDWALTGEKNKGWGPNEYCLTKGQEYLRQACAETDRVKRDRLFTQSWRAVGETMHLLADMTCVPHVRNDSHPGKALYITGNTDPNKGILRNDPYELFCNEEMIRNSKDYPVHPLITDLIDKAADPAGVFQIAAQYTNENFFSADTVGGTYIKSFPGGDGEVRVRPANGQEIYPLPELSKCRLLGQSGKFYRQLNSRQILVCHESWSSSVGWAQASMILTRDSVRDQASLLVPLAIYANANLMKRFIPDFDARVDSFDAGTGECAIRCVHEQSAYWTQPLEYKFGALERIVVWVNGVRKPEEIRNGTPAGTRITVNLNRFGIKAGDRLKVGVEIGGVLYTSKADYTVPQVAGQTIFVPTISWQLVDGAGKELATGAGPDFQKTVSAVVKYQKGSPEVQSTQVTTTVTAKAEAPETPSGVPFTITVSLGRNVTCNPPEPEFTFTSNIGLVIPNTTGGSISSLADATNPGDIALQLDFKPAAIQIYHIDQTGVPGFKGYVEAATLPHGSIGGYASNWNIATFAGNTGLTLNGNVRLRCTINPFSTIYLGTQGNGISHVLHCVISYRARQ